MSGLRKAALGEARRELDRLLTIETDDCVIWPFHRVAGYGRIKRNGFDVGVHVIACELEHGPAPTRRHEAAHSCGNRACLNRRHLRWATRSENAADMATHGTALRGEKHPRHKLTAADVLTIRQRHASGGVTLTALALEYGVHRATIRRCIEQQSWAWLGASA